VGFEAHDLNVAMNGEASPAISAKWKAAHAAVVQATTAFHELFGTKTVAEVLGMFGSMFGFQF
jgi:hypothetical protein